ncbi:MAG: helix-turn-helix transcriptional regulator [Candidatus Aminicenantes bacterium]|nr:MAG: helix-turn-helix transcriptional regulator [Candidatus Aminicenantes bacterium]
MQKEKFLRIRKKLNKTQKEMAVLLGISIKTVESYEQGLRNIPANVERIVYYLLFKLNMEKFKEKEPCWDIKKCPLPTRENCVAWIAKEGFFCWFLTGRVCTREKLLSGESTKSCFHCSFFKENLEKI